MSNPQTIKWDVIYAYTRQMAFEDGVLDALCAIECTKFFKKEVPTS